MSSLLVLGGTRFVGRAAAEAALADGHDVTLFHRGVTAPGLLPEATHLHGDRDGGLDALRGRSWDFCIDTSGYVPRVVRDSAELLADTAGRYVFVSTISVYADLAVPRDEEGPLKQLDEPTSEDVSTHYGELKVLCEEAVEAVFGERATIVRPGYVVGPHDPTGRFSWWVHRAARGGRMIVPAAMARAIQVIDARDLAAFLLRAATAPLTGTYNATGPVPPVSMLDAIRLAGEIAGAAPEPIVVDDALLTRAGLTGTDLPLWAAAPSFAAWAEIDCSRATGAGLVFRPFSDTVAGALRHAGTVDGLGLPSDREHEILDLLS